MTYRERRAAKAERLRGWSAQRAVKAAAELERASKMAEAIPMGQPILVGHHSETRDRNYRARIGRGFERSFEHENKSRDMARRADGIEAAAERAIYSDDPDAVERLRDKLEGLEAERARWKAYNAACRRARRKSLEALELLSPAQQAALYSAAKHAPHALGRYGEARGYLLSNLGGNITRTRARLASLERKAANDAG